MKRITKKLLSVALSAAMLLSMGVSAMAASDLTSNTKGSANGKGTTEGPLPNNVLVVNMPTTAANTFNMYLDPHGLIQATYGAKYEDDAAADNNKFATGTNLYFKHATADATSGIQYTDSSDELKIINKSNTPVDVKMTAQVAKNGAEFDFAADAAAAKAATDKATMYLAIVGKNDGNEFTQAVADIVADPNAVVEIAAPSVKLTDSDSGTPTGFIKDDEVTVAWADGVSDEAKTALLAKVGDMNIAFTDKAGSNGVKATLTLPTGYNEESGNGAAQYATSGNGDVAMSFVVGDGNADVLTIDFTFVDSVISQADGENGSIAGCKIEFEAAGSGSADSEAELTQTVENIPEAYTESVTEQDGTKVYEYTLTDDYKSTGSKKDNFKALTFQLTGAINTGTVWDEAFAADKEIKIDVIWDVVANTSGQSNNGGTSTESKAPVVTVVTPATAAAGEASITIDMGSGSKAVASLDRITYTRNTGTVNNLAETNYSFTDGAGTLTAVRYLFEGETGANVHFYFKNAAGNDVQVDVDVRTAGDYTVSA